jgi:hypothetical protein
VGLFTLPLSFKLWKQSLNSDDQQFHKYQQNKQPPQAIEHKIDHYIWH